MAYLTVLALHPFPRSPHARPCSPPQPRLPIHIQTMLDPWTQPWSDGPHAPQISKYDYVAEKSMLAGSFIGSILYGTPAHTFVYSRSLRLSGLF